MINKPYSLVSSFTQGTIPISKGGTGGETATEARTNLEVMKVYDLYNNSSGTQSTIILSDSSENYEYIEIYFRNNTNCYDVSKIYNANGRSISLNTSEISFGKSRGYVKVGKILFSGNTVTFTNDAGQVTLIGADTPQFSTGEIMWIYKIVGYKY